MNYKKPTKDRRRTASKKLKKARTKIQKESRRKNRN